MFIILTFTFILAILFKWFKFKCGNRRRESFNPFNSTVLNNYINSINNSVINNDVLLARAIEEQRTLDLIDPSGPETSTSLSVCTCSNTGQNIQDTSDAVKEQFPSYTNFHFYHFKEYINSVVFCFTEYTPPLDFGNITTKLKLKYLLDNYKNLVKLLNIYNRIKNITTISDLFKNLVDIDYEATLTELGVEKIPLIESNIVTICDKLNFFHNNIIIIKDALVYFFTSLNIVNANNPPILIANIPITLFENSTVRLDSTTIVTDSDTEPVAVSTPSPPPPVTKCNSFKFLIHNSPNFKFIFDLLKNISNMYFTNSTSCTEGSDYRICPLNMSYSIVSRNCMCCGTNVRNTLTHPIDGVYNPSTHCTCGDSLYDWNNDQCIGVCSELLPSRKSRGNKNATSSPGFCQNRDKDCDPNLCYNNIESPGNEIKDDELIEYANLIPLSIQVTNKSDPTEMYCLSKNNVAGNSDGRLNDIGLAECNPSNCSQRFVAFKTIGPFENHYRFQYIGCEVDNKAENKTNLRGLLEIENNMDDNWSGISELHNTINYKMHYKMNTNNTAYFKGDGGMPHTRKMKNGYNKWYTWDKKSDSDNKQGMKSTELEGSEIHFLRR
jgi:uncharacterized protein (DUF2237 family)